MIRKTAKILLLLSAVAMMTACGPQVPQDYTSSDKQPDIYPDYKDVTVPLNMAPLTFEMEHEAEQWWPTSALAARN